MKIFGIGLSRTGTKSLSKALNLLGFSVNHFPRDELTIKQMEIYLKTGEFNLTVAEQFDAVVDMIPPVMFDGIYKKYPDAEYILTIRDPTSWFKSMEELYERHLNRLFRNFDGRPYAHLGDHVARAHKHLYGTEILDELIYKKRFLTYNHDMFFKKGGQLNLLTLDICGGDGWEKLCRLLNKDVPSMPFPHIVNVGDGENNYDYENVMV